MDPVPFQHCRNSNTSLLPSAHLKLSHLPSLAAQVTLASLCVHFDSTRPILCTGFIEISPRIMSLPYLILPTRHPFFITQEETSIKQLPSPCTIYSAHVPISLHLCDPTTMLFFHFSNLSCLLCNFQHAALHPGVVLATSFSFSHFSGISSEVTCSENSVTDIIP